LIERRYFESELCLKAVRCPYLGLLDDPDTALDFPSLGNTCHRTARPAPINLIYQQNTCLTWQHLRCPVYRSAGAVRPPALPARRSQRVFPLILLPLAALLLAGAGLAWSSGWIGTVRASETQPATKQAPGFNILDIPPEITSMPFVFPNPSSLPTPTACPPPDQWVAHKVRPSDTLFGLSIIYGVPLDVLQKANCLDSQYTLIPGQVIYIPAAPTAAPTPFPAPTSLAPIFTPPGG
jgi:hypothetical protein